MVRQAALALALAGLAACDRGFDRAVSDYEFKKQNLADSRELCRAARRAAEEAAKARDSFEYKMWTVQADEDCNT